ncbi:MAG: hypothetical protein GY870_05225 [archaeon]|nr:hypothetical protein [archaeon]
MSKKESQKTKVIIKWPAYVKMMKHVLRFGSNARDKSQYKEVMGMLIGELVDQPGIIKDVIIHDAVPISHGGKIEVAFNPQDYVSFSVVDAAFAEQGWFTVGWYHSHPGLTCFFSATDIRNQLGWQTSNPSAIGIVWDHTRLGEDKEDLGFDIFRLDDPGKGPMTEYHTVQWVVEPPEDLEFYREGIIDVINNISKGEPPILEINEVPDVFGDLLIPGQSAMKSKEPELLYTEIMEYLTDGINNIADIFLQPLLKYLNEWAKGISQGIINKNVIMLTNIRGLKENLSNSMGELQSWFKFALNDQLRNIDIYIDDKFELNEEERKKISNKLNDLTKSMNTTISDAFNEALEEIVSDISGQIKNSLQKLENTKKETKTTSEIVSTQKILAENILKTIKDGNKDISSIEKVIIEDVTKNLDKNNILSNVDEIQKQLDDIKISLKAIIGMVK